MKQNNIPSYSSFDFMGIGGEKDLLIFVENESDEYYQVILNKKEFDSVCNIINKAKIGFLLNCGSTKYSIEEIVDLSDD